MKILNSKQVKELDAYTIQHEPVASIDLMERACRAFMSWFTEKFDGSQRVGIICGTGNNGGDGLGIARLLNEWGYSVHVWIVKGGVPESADFKINLERLKGKQIEISEIVTEVSSDLFKGHNILIDAMFGSGLSRPVQGLYADAIHSFNKTDAIKVAVDIPSGLMADAASIEPIIRADYTVSFQLPKLAFLLPTNHVYTGRWILVNIGLNKSFIKAAESPYHFLQHGFIRKIKKSRSLFDHKGNYGRALLLAGSYGKMGAAVLAAKAAMRSGLGLLTVHVPRCGYNILQTSVPEAMVSVDTHEEFLTEIPALEIFDGIGIGPGLGQSEETAQAIWKLITLNKKPLVIDADGLNILANHPDWLNSLPKNSILTPHPKEFERLAGSWNDDFEKLEKLTSFAKKYQVIVVLKGAYSAICLPEGKIYFNSTGNPGMATGGAGDVLTGIITGILAQGYHPHNATFLGVYLHGLAGDLAAREMGMDGMIASDIIQELPSAYKKLF